MRLSDADAVGTFSVVLTVVRMCVQRWTFLGVWAGTKGLSTHAGSTVLIPPGYKKHVQPGYADNIS